MASNSTQVQHVAAASFASRVISRDIALISNNIPSTWATLTLWLQKSPSRQSLYQIWIPVKFRNYESWPHWSQLKPKHFIHASMGVINFSKSQVLVGVALTVAFKIAIYKHGLLPGETGPEIRQLGFNCSTSAVWGFQRIPSVLPFSLLQNPLPKPCNVLHNEHNAEAKHGVRFFSLCYLPEDIEWCNVIL